MDRFINLILRLPQSVYARVKTIGLKLMGAKIGRNCRLSGVIVPRNPWDILIETAVATDGPVTLLTTGERQATARIKLGENIYINKYVMIDASRSISIGAGTMIGPCCYITDHDHGTAEGENIADQGLSEADVVIGKNVWLGAGVKILKGVHIGDNAVIGAGSVVTRSVPENGRFAGVPARAIKPDNSD